MLRIVTVVPCYAVIGNAETEKAGPSQMLLVQAEQVLWLFFLSWEVWRGSVLQGPLHHRRREAAACAAHMSSVHKEKCSRQI